ncbi:putative reverse transcriptase domain-containing protein, partial [Tanacetum coccineum]
YFKGTLGKGIRYYLSNGNNNLSGYSDADWAKCLKTRKSVTEAEYRSLSSATCEIIRIQKLLLDLKTKVTLPIKNQIHAALDRQKSYADVRHKPLEFQVRDKVTLKALDKVRPIAYRLELPQQIRKVHSTFHVSNLNKCLSNETLVIPLEEIQIDYKLHFIEESDETLIIPIVKVRWNSKRAPEFNWEHEDQFQKKCPHLFSNTSPPNTIN